MRYTSTNVNNGLREIWQGVVKGKKVKLSLYLTKHHAMKACWGVEV
jgi:hypothetical protein